MLALFEFFFSFNVHGIEFMTKVRPWFSYCSNDQICTWLSATFDLYISECDLIRLRSNAWLGEN